VTPTTKLLRIVLIVMLVVDVSAAAVLLSPLGGLRSSRQTEYERVRLQWQAEQRKAAPLRDIDKKLDEARQQVSSFYGTRLPTRSSAIPEELGKLAAANGVRFFAVRYNSDEAAVEGLRRIQIDASLAGDYLKVVKFINTLERDKMFFVVDTLNLAEQQGGNVRLELRLETYLRQT
jgi:type IV pilus assembly protein PilO